jgi:hypothetical protein
MSLRPVRKKHILFQPSDRERERACELEGFGVRFVSRGCSIYGSGACRRPKLCSETAGWGGMVSAGCAGEYHPQTSLGVPPGSRWWRRPYALKCARGRAASAMAADMGRSALRARLACKADCTSRPKGPVDKVSRVRLRHPELVLSLSRGSG